ncbi:hypothetical protein K1719_021231 [Acacia pycnantha]|nr:hypothetical protein K1719_021231 [Acacia pycnantha]
MGRSCVLVCDVSLRSGKHEILFGTSSCKAFPEAYTFGRFMGATWYGIWAPSSSNLEVGNQVHQDDPVNEAVRDAFGVQDDNFTQRCRLSKYSKLSFLIKLYHIKCMCGITDKAMSMFPELLRDAFPDADIPSSFYEAKKIIND